MLNLFIVFDPSTFYMSMNWMSSILSMFMLPQMYWLLKSRLIWIYMYMFNLLLTEFKILLVYKFNIVNNLYFLIMFFYILLNNYLGLFMYIFTSSSHLVFSMWLTFSMWLSFMMFGWYKNMNFMFIHLVPLGTPFILMFFMVIIETLSNLIRPLTLCIRLTANMIAGHLLLVLLSIFIIDLINIYIMILILQIMLLILEMSVSIIQSYVFTILMILYMKEINYD
uniref:ATP synthase subunit a n=1 Tax=Xiphozele sp. QL-2014 TaxID=1491726 RepID=A0A0U1WEJ6_9HYME|nr:ATP synthase F0 subunit 6 [Xiphozele sp. QL-2014]